MQAKIIERGNGYADVGDYVSGDDGEVYTVVSFRGPIFTNRAGNFMHATVELADWADVTDDNEPTCSAELYNLGGF